MDILRQPIITRQRYDIPDLGQVGTTILAVPEIVISANVQCGREFPRLIARPHEVIGGVRYMAVEIVIRRATRRDTYYAIPII